MSSGLLVMHMPAGSIHKVPYNCTLSKKLEKWAVRVGAEGSSLLTAGSSDPSLCPWRVITQLLLHWREGDHLTEHSDSWLREVSRCCWEASLSQLSKIWPPSAFPKQPSWWAASLFICTSPSLTHLFWSPHPQCSRPKTLFSHFSLFQMQRRFYGHSSDLGLKSWSPVQSTDSLSWRTLY